jgi:hypothetical protein
MIEAGKKGLWYQKFDQVDALKDDLKICAVINLSGAGSTQVNFYWCLNDLIILIQKYQGNHISQCHGIWT